MVTELAAIESARQQYRIAFKQMAAGGRWNIFATKSGVILDLKCTHSVVLVENVQAKTEQQTINALSAVLKAGRPEIWGN